MRVLLAYLVLLVLLTWSKSSGVATGQEATLTLVGEPEAVNQGTQYTLSCVASTEDVISEITLTINGQDLMIGRFIFGGNPNRTTVDYFNFAVSAANNGQVAQCHYRNVSSNHIVISVVGGTENSILLNVSPPNVIRNREFTVACSTDAVSNITLRINGDPIEDSRNITIRRSIQLESFTSSFIFDRVDDLNNAVVQCTVGERGSNPFAISIAEQDCTNTGQFECEQMCTDIPGGGFDCSCGNGFVGAAQCQDVDECSMDNGGCEQECVNTNGSRVCLSNCESSSGNTGSGDSFYAGFIVVAVLFAVSLTFIVIVLIITIRLGHLYHSKKKDLEYEKSESVRKIKEKDTELAKKNRELEKNDKDLKAKEWQLQEKITDLENMDQKLRDKDREINKMKSALQEKKPPIN